MFDYLPTFAVVYILILAGIFGAFLGSGLNCLAYRMAHGQKWSSGRSVCPHCGKTLTARDLIPIFSYLILKGKCRQCGTPISKRYVLTECLLAVVFVSVVWRYQLSLNTLSILILCCCLFCLSLIDLDTQIIPDRFLIIPAVVRAIQLVIEGGFSGLLSGILPGIALGGGVLILSLIMDKILKKDTMGGGDIKLLAVLGMFLSFPECLLMLVIACVIGIVMASVMMKVDSETPFPFGPALAISGWLTLLIGSPLINLYLSLF